MRTALAIGLAFWAAQASAQVVVDDSSLPPAKMKALRTELGKRLADPQSAQLRDLHLKPGTQEICGQMNAKNRFGGYVGFRHIYYDPKSGLFTAGDDPVMNKAAMALCSSSSGRGSQAH